MWIVRLALARPYTFIVLALLILILAPVIILRTPTDIFPEHRYPGDRRGVQLYRPERRGDGRAHHLHLRTVAHHHGQRYRAHRIAVHRWARHHQGVLPARRQRQRRGSPGERHFAAHPPAVAARHRRRRFCSLTTPPACPSCNSALAGRGLSEQALFDYGVNFIRTRLVTIPGCAIPYPYGGKQRQIMVDINPAAMQSKGLSPADITAAIANQNLIIPAGTSKIGQFEYDVDLNSSPTTVEAFNDFPDQGGERLARLHPRYRPRARRLRAADQYRSPGWQPRRAAHRDEGRQRFHAGGGGRRPQAAAGGRPPRCRRN